MATPTIALQTTPRVASSAGSPVNTTLNITIDPPRFSSWIIMMDLMLRAIASAIIITHASCVVVGDFATSITVNVDSGSGNVPIVLTPAAPGVPAAAALEAVRAWNAGVDNGWQQPQCLTAPGMLA